MADMVDEFEAIEEKYKFTFKKEQKEAISAILNGDDVFAVLPTGFGVSYIYPFLPELSSAQRNLTGTVLVISPLQVTSITASGITGFPSVSSMTDDVTRFWREEREEGAIYNVYLKKVTYHTLSENENKNPDEFSHLMWETQKSRVIKAGNLEKLVEFLYTKGEMDSTYVNVFFATYRTFSSTEEVLDLLINRYKALKTDTDVKSELHDVQIRTIKSVMSVWMDSYPEDFRDPPSYSCLHTLESFAKQHIPESDLSVRARHKIEKFKKEDLGNSDMGIDFHFNLCDEVDHMIVAEYRKPLVFGEIRNTTVAEQLTYRDAELFKKVVPHQCLGAVWARRARKEGKGNTVAGTVLATIEQFNRVSLRVIATILKHTDLKTTQRAKIIQKWIDIAQELRNLKSFSSLKAIISGLQANSIYRLRKTWGAVPKEDLARFEELSDIFSNENNQLASRNLLMKEATAKFAMVDSSNKTLRRKNQLKRQSMIDNGIAQGTVPYLGTFLTDLTMIDTALPDTLDDLINFEKRRKEFEVLAQIKLLQSASQIYTFTENTHFWEWFDAVRVYDENESYELSCAIEPPEGGVKLKKKSSSTGQRVPKSDSNRLSLCMFGALNFDNSTGSLDSPASPSPGLHNTEHTHTVIQRVLDKYDVTGKIKDYCLLQVLPESELLIPEKSNVFYAMNNTGELNFVLRTKEEHEALQQKKKGRRKLKKLSI